MKKLFYSSFYLLLIGQAQSQHSYSTSFYPGSGTYSKKFADALSFVSNPATLSQIKVAGVGLFAERKYSLKELSFYTTALAIPTSYGGFGIIARYNGFKDYNETQFGLAYSKSLGSIDIGAQFNYYSVSIAGYGSSGVVTADAGMIWHILERVNVGIVIMNMVAGKLKSIEAEKPAIGYKLGIGYDISPLVFLSTEIVKEENNLVNIIAALQYKVDDKFFLRGGIYTSTTSPWLGAGLAWKNFRVDITSSYHPQLGISPGLFILYTIKQNKE